MILEFFSILRGDLAKRIYSKLDGRVEAVFGDSIETVEQSESEVRVSFRHEPPRCFDLVIGADGLHSTVRSIAFGNEAEFEKYLGYTTAAFSADAYPPRDEGCYVSYCTPGCQVARCALSRNRATFFFIFKQSVKPNLLHLDLDTQKTTAIIARRFGPVRALSTELLQLLTPVPLTTLHYPPLPSFSRTPFRRGQP
jgi:2-polyprenyl-6-methoxyphenol hydroxylase-like FAD-dependent oxidoreductase